MNAGKVDISKQPHSRGAIANMSESKRTALAQDIAISVQQGIAEGEDPMALISQRTMEFMVLAKALKHDGAFISHVAQHITTILHRMDPSLHVQQPDVAAGIQPLLTQYRVEAIQSADLLCDPAFIESLPEAVKNMAFGLSDNKLKDIARKLAQKDPQPNDTEAQITIAGIAIPKHIMLGALASLYDPANSPLLQPLADALRYVSPHITEERATLVAGGWLTKRHREALAGEKELT